MGGEATGSLLTPSAWQRLSAVLACELTAPVPPFRRGLTERMTSADTAWLHMDRPTNLMVVTCVSWFDEPVDWDRMTTALLTALADEVAEFRHLR